MSGTRVTELKVGGRVLRAGDTVKITGMRGTWKIKYVDTWPDSGRAAEFTVVGVPSGHTRTVFAEAIGVRKALASNGGK